jgi:FAD synthase
VEELNRPLANGVYGVIVEYGGYAYIGVMNKGVRPTLADREPQVHYEVISSIFPKIYTTIPLQYTCVSS